MKRVVFNQKGGVGKTTIVCNLAAVAAARGYRTLVIDLDTQANATRYLLGDTESAAPRTIADFFEGTLSFSLGTDPFERYATETPFENLDLVVASPELEALQPKLEAKQKVQKLRQALDKMKAYDRVFIDTPPAMNFYSRSALIASDYVLIPFDCDDFARQALYTLLENIAEIREDHNQALDIEGIVVNQFTARARLPSRIVDELRAEGQPVLEPLLSASVKVKESHEAATPLVYLDGSHKVTREYIALFDAIDE